MLGDFQEAFVFFWFDFPLPTCVHVSRCGDVYITSNSCCSVLLFLYYLKCNVPFPFSLKHVPCFVILVWLQYSRWVCIIYEDLLVLFCFVSWYAIIKKYAAPPITNEMWYLKDLNKTQVISFHHVLFCYSQSVGLTHTVWICPFETESSPSDWTIRK